MNRRLLLHIGFWLAYALYDGYLSTPWSGKTFESLGFWERLSIGYRAELVLLMFKIPAVYFVLYRLLPRSFQTKKYLVFGLQVLVTAAVFSFVNQFAWHNIIYPHIHGLEETRQKGSFWVELFRLGWSSIDIMMLFSVASALKLFRMRLQAAETERQLTAEKLQSELQFLRSQTNPHFLFNTLNNLYHLARKQSQTTPDAILKLSDLLRFMLYECTTPRIRLAQEIKVIRDYLDLERLRYGNRLDVDFQVEADDDQQLIAPLLLLPFVENAFKHGAAESRGETWVKIFLSLKNGVLDFRVENAKDTSETEIREGIGLKNVKRQLELVYPKHELTLDNTLDRFIAKLSIPLV
jgi:hypothetical protein